MIIIVTGAAGIRAPRVHAGRQNGRAMRARREAEHVEALARGLQTSRGER